MIIFKQEFALCLSDCRSKGVSQWGYRNCVWLAAHLANVSIPADSSSSKWEKEALKQFSESAGLDKVKPFFRDAMEIYDGNPARMGDHGLGTWIHWKSEGMFAPKYSRRLIDLAGEIRSFSIAKRTEPESVAVYMGTCEFYYTRLHMMEQAIQSGYSMLNSGTSDFLLPGISIAKLHMSAVGVICEAC